MRLEVGSWVRSSAWGTLGVLLIASMAGFSCSKSGDESADGPSSSGDGDGSGSGDGDGGDPAPLGPPPVMVEPERGELCGDDDATDGPVVADLRSLTRVNGVSPETIYFSAQESTDENCQDFSGASDPVACASGQHLGFHFNFDDPDSDIFETTGNPKNQQIGGAPRAIHTFVCEGEESSRFNAATGRCEYAVKVRVQGPSGDFDDACLQVNIEPQSEAYSPDETYCVSSDGDYADCPADVPASNHLTDSPDPGSYEGRRVLFQEGSSGEYSPVCIRYSEKNVRVGTYGVGERPVVSRVQVGVDEDCGENAISNRVAERLPTLTKDEEGYVTQGWAYDVGVSGLKVGGISNGMAATLVTFHDLDLDWSESGEHSGSVAILSSGQNCLTNDSLDCSNVPYPYGVFLSELRSIAHPDNLPLVNFGCFTQCGLVNGGMVGVEAKNAREHNARFMGSWGLVVSNAALRGGHLGGAGPKTKITLRQLESGTLSSPDADPENFYDGNANQSGPGFVRAGRTEDHFTPHFNFIVDSVFGDTEQEPGNDEAGYVVFLSGNRYGGIFGSSFLAYPEADTNSSQLQLGGSNIVALDQTFNGVNVECRTTSSGRHESNAYYYDESAIFTDIDGRCNGEVGRGVPTPDAPD